MSLIQNATATKIQTAATEGNIFCKRCYGKIELQGKANDVVRVMLTHPPYENHIIPRIYLLPAHENAQRHRQLLTGTKQ
jgi:23S rRNA pseudouridine1911/1915/1917 synthase